MELPAAGASINKVTDFAIAKFTLWVVESPSAVVAVIVSVCVPAVRAPVFTLNCHPAFPFWQSGADAYCETAHTSGRATRLTFPDATPSTLAESAVTALPVFKAQPYAFNVEPAMFWLGVGASIIRLMADPVAVAAPTGRT